MRAAGAGAGAANFGAGGGGTGAALDAGAGAIGSVRTVAGSNQSGFDVTVTRKVYEHGKLKRRDAFTSAYIAVGPTTIYGPGRSIPGPYFVLPRV